MNAYKYEAEKKGTSYVDNLKIPPKTEPKYTQKELMEKIKDQKKNEQREKKRFIKSAKKYMKDKKMFKKTKKTESSDKDKEEF